MTPFYVALALGLALPFVMYFETKVVRYEITLNKVLKSRNDWDRSYIFKKPIFFDLNTIQLSSKLLFSQLMSEKEENDNTLSEE